MPVQQVKRWCFTVSCDKVREEAETPLSMEECRAVLMFEKEAECQYLIVGCEVGEDGYEHLQCYVQLKKKKSMNQMKALFKCNSMHLEIARGSGEENKVYCSKGGNFLEIGEITEQGQRKDIDEILSIIKDGGTVKECWDKHPGTMVRVYRGVQEYAAVCQTRKAVPKYQMGDFPWEVTWDYNRSVIFTGEAGIGKTSFARACLPDALLINDLNDLKLYDAKEYDGLIFDDMCFVEQRREMQIHLMDIEEGRSIRILYGLAFVPKNTKKIFTTNVQSGRIVDLNDKAVARRVHVVQLAK